MRMPPYQNVFSMLATGRGPTVKAIQNVLQRIGGATSGSKDVLQTRLLKEMRRVKFPDPHRTGKTSRILSIDMGIRNLAFCVADVDLSPTGAGAAKMNIVAWRRMDLTEEVFRSTLKTKGELVEEAELDGREDGDPFTPESLSKTAYWFLKRDLLYYGPDVVLIERQRWRSSSSAAIQQWTVRVNTLEAMLWAVLETLRYEGRPTTTDPTPKHWWVFSVDPKRVGHFWLNGEADTVNQGKSKKKSAEDTLEISDEVEDVAASESSNGTHKKLSRGKAEKRAKIQLLRTWLNSDDPSTTLSHYGSPDGDDNSIQRPDISFSFRIDPHHKAFNAEATRQTLLYATDKPTERAKRTEVRKTEVKKVDDITDCFLQAAAWVAWEKNRMQLWPQRENLRVELEEKLGRQLTGLWGPDSVEEAWKELQAGGGAKKTEKTSGTKKATKRSTKIKKKAS